MIGNDFNVTVSGSDITTYQIINDSTSFNTFDNSNLAPSFLQYGPGGDLLFGNITGISGSSTSTITVNSDNFRAIVGQNNNCNGVVQDTGHLVATAFILYQYNTAPLGALSWDWKNVNIMPGTDTPASVTGSTGTQQSLTGHNDGYLNDLKFIALI